VTVSCYCSICDLALGIRRESTVCYPVCIQIRFDEKSGNLAVTDLGRIASHYYLHNDTIFTFNERLARQAFGAVATDADALNLICSAHEFEQIKVER
jgi:replicative superfamily II helicase